MPEKKTNQLKANSCKRCSVGCEPIPSDCKKTFHVDHDHSTGKIRDLLCHHCNTSLGGFKEDSMILYKAINYLIKHQGEKQ